MKKGVFDRISSFLKGIFGGQGESLSTVKRLTNDFSAQSDLKKRRLVPDGGTSGYLLIYLDSMADGKLIANNLVKPLLEQTTGDVSLDNLQQAVSINAETLLIEDYDDMIKKLINGYCLLFDENKDNVCLCCDVRVNTGRSITEPPTGGVSKGPREGFVEDAKTNLTLLKKRLKHPSFVADNMTVGRYTQTSVYVCYIGEIIDKKTVKRVKSILSQIDIDGVVDSSYLARFLDTDKSGFFKTVGSTEKPDIAVSKLLEGRVCIIADGSPMVLTLPYMFLEDLHSPEDYYLSARTATTSRFLRLFSVGLAVFIPSLYVALQVFNYQILPSKFLITILTSTQAIPFKPFEEMLLVLVLFDILREANFRMPQFAGISLSVVGAVVLGDAAVKAGLLGAPAVVIGALSGIGLYAMPDNTLLFSFLRLVFLIVGSLAGLFGLCLVGLCVVGYVVSLDSYGSPYGAPFAPDVKNDQQDAIVKLPLEKLVRRPKAVRNINEVRQK